MKEKDIEDAFCLYVNALDSPLGHNEVFGRQVQLFEGIADVIGVLNDIYVFVAEIKRGVIDERACTQLIGYTEQVDHMIREGWADSILNRDIVNRDVMDLSSCAGVLVGESLSHMAERMIRVSGTIFFRYSVEGNQISFDRVHMGYGYYGVDTPAACKGVIAKVIDAIKNSYHVQRES